ncbi:glycosyltransferase [Alteromonas sp. ASW11-36]|uniref:Glycosyltransferase n=1 Tax=Alteromonas arenosi TaxID=3055817 RepID=A0ABT7T0K2_9ALTE|nr:glycosyltransferase [Alteromonas sp. ASW11-36]MDM7861973.1 glycosyltransferase [Alteromonas sp. ASW11-36]
MKILIIGDNPAIVGGVCNYTRPLFQELGKEKSIEVAYLYSSSRVKPDYTFYAKTQIVPDTEQLFENVFKLINSANLDQNYENLALDIASKKNDRAFESFIQMFKPDVVHINENIGFSSNIINIAKREGAKVVYSVHEYWALCPKRVMVDFNNRVCEGPSNLSKCTHCIEQRMENYSSFHRKTVFHMERNLPGLIGAVRRQKAKFTKTNAVNKAQRLQFGESKFPTNAENKKLYEQLSKRLSSNIEALNNTDVIIGVSSDVKAHLVKYGVYSEKIIVQHIGSAIAGNKIKHDKQIDPSNIKIGYIGGVSFYKGVHQLIEAYLGLSAEYQSRSSLEIFGGFSPSYKLALDEAFDVDNHDSITIHGRYKPSELIGITNSIDLSVLPSLCADTAPQTIFESFNSGLPIIAPSIGGFSDFVKDGVNGLIYEGESVTSLREKLAAIISEPELLQKFSMNIPETKSIQENTVELLKLYSELVEKD